MGCSQAAHCLDGHKLGVTAIAWMDVEGTNKARIASCSQDSEVLLFEVDKDKLSELKRWSDCEIAEDKKRSSVLGRTPSKIETPRSISKDG